MKKFEFNKNGVCQNPNIAFDIKTIKPEYSGHYEIKTAERDGKWANGVSYYFNEVQAGGGSGVSHHSDYYTVKVFDTEKEAVIAELNYRIEYLKKYSKSYKSVNSLVLLLKDVRNTMMHEQLQLF